MGSAGALSFSAIACPLIQFCAAVDANGYVTLGAQRRISTPARPRCDVHRPNAPLVSTQVIVFAVFSADATRYYACTRPVGAAAELGEELASDPEYGPDGITGDFRAAGSYSSAQSASGLVAAEMCSKYMPGPDCPTGNYWIRVLDAGSGRSVDFGTPGQASAVTLSGSGAVAWLQRNPTGGTAELLATALRPDGQTGLSGSARELDTGAIDPKSLGFAGLTLHWTKDGQSHEQTLQ